MLDHKVSRAPTYIGCGLNYSGLFSKTASDILGIGIAYAGTSSEVLGEFSNEFEGYELAVELSYALPLFDNVTLQPDFQYVINPGADKILDNAFLGFIRLIIEH